MLPFLRIDNTNVRKVLFRLRPDSEIDQKIPNDREGRVLNELYAQVRWRLGRCGLTDSGAWIPQFFVNLLHY